MKLPLAIFKCPVAQEWTTEIGKARALFETRLLNELPPVLVGKGAIKVRSEQERILLEIYETI